MYYFEITFNNILTYFVKYSNEHITKLIIALVILQSCAKQDLEKSMYLKHIEFAQLQSWRDDNHAKALEAFKKSCKVFEKKQDDQYLHISRFAGKYKQWKEICHKTSDDLVDNPKQFFEENFNVYKVKDKSENKGLFTGYFEATINGSFEKTQKYKYPIYAKPSDLENSRIYHSRSEIENGVLDNKNLEILWTDDKIALFFMHIQGSGKIILPDGNHVKLGFAAKNNHKYYSIGRYFISENIMNKDQVSAESIKSWLYNNPDKVDYLLNKNPSYIFFKQIVSENPIGAQNVPLTPMRSLAIDNRYIPYGLPIWLDAKINGDNSYHQSLMIAQDTGSAIKGIIRGDIFFGSGEKAEYLASHQNSLGQYYILLPKDIKIRDGKII